jgi:hypothetical protein
MHDESAIGLGDRSELLDLYAARGLLSRFGGRDRVGAWAAAVLGRCCIHADYPVLCG